MVAVLILATLVAGGLVGAVWRRLDRSRSSVTSRSIDNASLDAQAGFRGVDGPQL